MGVSHGHASHGRLLIGVCLRRPRGFQIFQFGFLSLHPHLIRTYDSTERLSSERLKSRYFSGTWSAPGTRPFLPSTKLPYVAHHETLMRTCLRPICELFITENR